MKKSGVKRIDLVNEGWVSFLEGTDLDYEYTLKEYYELLKNAVKMHCMYGKGLKYKPGMPLYERYNDIEFKEKVKSL